MLRPFRFTKTGNTKDSKVRNGSNRIGGFGEVGRGVREEGFEFRVGAQATAQDHPDVGAGQAIAQATSATCGPLAPSLSRWRRQAVGGTAASAATSIGPGAVASTRARVRGHPCPVPAGTLTAGRSSQTRVVCGTSAMYHKSSAARRSSRAVSRPKPSSQRVQRADSCPRARSPATISPANSGCVRNATSAGTPHRRRRAA